MNGSLTRASDRAVAFALLLTCALCKVVLGHCQPRKCKRADVKRSVKECCSLINKIWLINFDALIHMGLSEFVLIRGFVWVSPSPDRFPPWRLSR